MSNRIAKVSTKLGDSGQTSLASNRRLSKSSQVIHILGELDALNVAFGWVGFALKSFDTSKLDTKEYALLEPQALLVQRMQSALLDIGAQIACEDKNSRLDPKLLSDMEEQASRFTKHLGPLKEFLLPGGVLLAMHAHEARILVRQIERHWVGFCQDQVGLDSDHAIGAWLNRSSDYFFQLARLANSLSNQKELLWLAHQKS